MRIVILDEKDDRREQIIKSVSQDHTVIACKTSNDLLTALNEADADLLAIEVPSWKNGRSLYNYFQVPAKVQSVKICFYNAPELFSEIEGRIKHEDDQVLPSGSTAEQVVEAISAAA